MRFLSRSRLQCKHKLFINVGYPKSNFSKRTTSGTNNGSKIKLTTHRISAHNRNVLCQIYIKRQQYFCISGISNRADPGFQVRGGAHLKKSRRAEGGAKVFGVFRVKNHDFTPTNHIFSNFRRGGARAGCAPPPGSAPE